MSRIPVSNAERQSVLMKSLSLNFLRHLRVMKEIKTVSIRKRSY